MCSRGYIIRIVRITDSLFRLFENLLTVINQFLFAMRVVESNQVSQSSHVCVRERCEIIRNLGPEFIQQRGKLVIGVSEHVTSIGIRNSGTEAFHHCQRVLCKRNRLFIAREPAAMIPVLEKADTASDSRPLVRARL